MGIHAGVNRAAGIDSNFRPEARWVGSTRFIVRSYEPKALRRVWEAKTAEGAAEAGLHQARCGARTHGRGASPKRPFPPKHGRLGEASLPSMGLVASLMQPCR